MMSERLELACIRTDGGCQPRSTMFLDVVEEYSNAMAIGAEFPPVVVFYDGSDYWLADGYHRREAAETLGLIDIAADVRQGTRRDAILFSVSANAAHGMRRTNEDKRRAVLVLLNDLEWSIWSDGEIARRCAVTREYVNRLRPRRIEPDTCDQITSATRTFIHPKTGQATTMNTARIGGGSQSSQPVFDSTEFARNAADPTATPPHTTRPASIDLRDSHLWHALRDAVEAIKSLPSPSETAARFPRVLEHVLRSDDVIQASKWLSEFADLWAEGQKIRDERSAAVIQRAKELMGNVTTH